MVKEDKKNDAIDALIRNFDEGGLFVDDLITLLVSANWKLKR